MHNRVRSRSIFIEQERPEREKRTRRTETWPRRVEANSAGRRCENCEEIVSTNGCFCPSCGEQIQPTVEIPVWRQARPSLFRRMGAELIDRIVPFVFLPVLAVPVLHTGLRNYAWLCALVIGGWHLIRDCTPARRSLGKKLAGMRVVSERDQRPVPWKNTMLRRLFPALTQVGYAIGTAEVFARMMEWDRLRQAIAEPWPGFAASSLFLPAMILWPILYDLFSLAAIQISSEGKRLEDWGTGTRVILESAYMQGYGDCGNCGQRISNKHLYCAYCGAENSRSDANR